MRNNENYFSCYVFFEHCHYDAVNSRKTLSFKMFSIEIKIEIEALFSPGIAPSRAFNEFLRNLQSNSEDELNFHLRKMTDPSVQEGEALIRHILNIARRNLEVNMVR